MNAAAINLGKASLGAHIPQAMYRKEPGGHKPFLLLMPPLLSVPGEWWRVQACPCSSLLIFLIPYPTSQCEKEVVNKKH
jgi:hypothetical protein